MWKKRAETEKKKKQKKGKKGRKREIIKIQLAEARK